MQNFVSARDDANAARCSAKRVQRFDRAAQRRVFCSRRGLPKAVYTLQLLLHARKLHTRLRDATRFNVKHARARARANACRFPFVYATV